MVVLVLHVPSRAKFASLCGISYRSEILLCFFFGLFLRQFGLFRTCDIVVFNLIYPSTVSDAILIEGKHGKN